MQRKSFVRIGHIHAVRRPGASIMQPRLDFTHAAPAAIRAFNGIEGHLRKSHPARQSSGSTVSAGHETPFFTDRERAALLWTKHITRISQKNVPDEVSKQVSQYFPAEELVNLYL